ncbi:cob(I)yrinic acid a,c-diamide adenosyltransferase [Candidatus Daviesbacteria bacterium RIFCSPLOWO2_01_FULL_43_38]|uniref:Cob(I)yrinic acid a,c-diamide adenosyltransferase n=1 Tax=Candidatus Daviesbacteria bacterium RIFCSPHIGHO2_12_FULL_43_11 TaxID=1797780 RepID=A0A1F5K6J5_9BACT|nr:MAG: cob(I)yrinic acid a,c-diamide adenosyltransferase [Candidatus Daviesbacteria bacterium RIFCSPHIGHO2_01_FULL_43_17]OGE36428.1 MAG: cob(I)yrinic acid a,c-diamide adenosyltransferase [Candidatus Daviesbacteria bacterium RIFCSPHIGHO2_12_FULL_43_11]OGE63837.1 MAG: cob(I)yrinic acid a,c-diamide adenosyltransferase [Candidatus Daviesbacteria bacterium RIFCSPLOWO2_01_FULL_43_38]OGE69019.1 MAG: cob(I)yrinic acid a,c-diamide adenosyltransferase [Candidatus Daviesbacteria bacterium RIFCSPLOWO2_02_F
MVIVYTGEGKGKTTAALGLALRAAGYKKKILIVQFGKAAFSGELEPLKLLKPYIKVIQGGKGFVGIKGDKLPREEHKKAAQKTYNYICKETISGKWDVVVADEIIGTVAAKLVSLSQVLKLIKDKPQSLDLVLTGRLAHQKLIAIADLVTEMKSIKHPFTKGIQAKEGIDF